MAGFRRTCKSPTIFLILISELDRQLSSQIHCCWYIGMHVKIHKIIFSEDHRCAHVKIVLPTSLTAACTHTTSSG
jgi:hypothetical protein